MTKDQKILSAVTQLQTLQHDPDTESAHAEADQVLCNLLEQLKEENAELKEKLNFSTQYYRGEKAKEHLTKAKELLTRFVMASVYFNGKETDLIKEAEQFLKECE